eukprot:GHVU01215022.1.p1 GENE.GHVU01215022.1~~GHVU01215022.1.p1  ORF type:complete len:513 (-),score=46.76 GHVU01215022.1:6-1544(-)
MGGSAWSQDAKPDPSVAEADSTEAESENATLHQFVKDNDLENVSSLLYEGAPVHIDEVHDDCSALYLAVKEKRVAMFNMLLEAGASADIGHKNEAPLHAAGRTGQSNMCVELLKHGADPDVISAQNTTCLETVIQAGHTDLVALLLRNGVCPDGPVLNNKAFPGRRSSLHYAVKEERGDLVALLLSYDAIPDVQDEENLTPLHLASRTGQNDVIKLLIEAACDLNIKRGLRSWDQGGYTPLHEAVKHEQPKTVRLLSDSGADMNAQDDHMRTPLLLACELGFENVAKTLIQCGCDVNLSDLGNDTPLIYATKSNKKSLVLELLQAKCDVDFKGAGQRTAMHHSAEKGYHNITNLFLNAGANLRWKDKYRKTSLQYAISAGKFKTVFYLLQHSYQLPGNSCKGYELLRLLSNREYRDITHLLISLGWKPYLCDGDRIVSFLNCSNAPKHSVTWMCEQMKQPMKLIHLSRNMTRKCLQVHVPERSILSNVRKLPIPDNIQSYLELEDIQLYFGI